MGKFDGLLLLSDLDDTLLTADKRVSEENSRAAEYFMREGGLFTFATGRVVAGARLMLEYIRPNAPMVCYNGAAIYDFSSEKMLWSRATGKDAEAAVEYIDKKLPFVGVEICTKDKIYLSKVNDVVRAHQKFERLPDNFLDYHDVAEDWIKVLFMTDEDKLHLVKEAIAESEFKDRFTFVQSSPWYYELLPKNTSKGEGLIRLAEILSIPVSNTIAVGDNENDLTLISRAGCGIAVENAVAEVKARADHITVDNTSHCIRSIVESLENGEITIK